MATKRDHTGKPVVPRPAGQFTVLFEGFRIELDEHHDRRERLVKASRDVTALSKKIIFSLQRADGINKELFPRIQSEVNARLVEIQKILLRMLPDLHGQNRHRYARQLQCMEELVEALSMAHYLQTQTLITPSELIDVITTPVPASKDASSSSTANEPVCIFPPEARDLLLTESDYIFGIADLFGEMMRFATARTRAPGVLVPEKSPHGRSVLNDIQALGFAFETLPKREGDKIFMKKVEAMRPSVKKVEMLGYRLAIQSGEHPEGWVPDAGEDVEME